MQQHSSHLSVPTGIHAILLEAYARRERQERRAAKREQRHAYYRAEEARKVRAALRRAGITSFNVNDPTWVAYDKGREQYGC